MILELAPPKAIDSRELKACALSLGFQSAGVCPALPAPHLAEYEQWIGKGYHGSMEYLARHLAFKSSPQELLSGARSVIAVALNYNRPSPDGRDEARPSQKPHPSPDGRDEARPSQKPHPSPDGRDEARPSQRPRIARYALGRDYHKVMRGKLRKLAAWIENEHPGARTRACVDSAPILERDYAQQAGLGWYGKNTMLIDSRRGSWFFIGLLLTTAEFEPDRPAAGGCGTCRKCIEACPTQAIVFEESRWQLDARKCISYLTIEHRGPLEADLHGWTFGCDVCQEVCPFNEPRDSQPERAAVTQEPDFLIEKQWPSLEELAVIQEGEWDALTVGSPIRRTGIEGIRRNARINLTP